MPLSLQPAGNVPLPVAAEPAFAEFCRSVGKILKASPEKETPGRVAELLRPLLGMPGLLSDEQRAAPRDGYGRHRVFICPEDRFSVLAMVWPPGIRSPVHDHKTWCAFGVHEGVLEETRYRPLDGRASPVARRRYAPGEPAHLPVDAPNIHCMHNPGDAPTVTVHVYGGNCETLGPNLDKVYAVAPQGNRI